MDEEKKIILNDTAQISPKDEHVFDDIEIEDYRQKFNKKFNKKKVKKTSFTVKLITILFLLEKKHHKRTNSRDTIIKESEEEDYRAPLQNFKEKFINFSRQSCMKNTRIIHI